MGPFPLPSNVPKIERRSSSRHPVGDRSSRCLRSHLASRQRQRLPQDMIESEILLRLPIQSLFRFKCVSKRYESLISDPDFGNLYLQRAQSSPESWSSSGLVGELLFPFTLSYRYMLSKNVKILSSGGGTLNEIDQLPISVCYVSLPIDENHEIRASTNGLILSVVVAPFRTFRLRVSNPLTKQRVRIPQSSTPTLTRYRDLEFCIATKPPASYKIVLIQYKIGRLFIQENAEAPAVEIFSSDTGSWASWKVRGFPGDDFSDTGTVQAKFAHRGVLHWLGRRTGTVITYNPYDDPGRFGRIRLPPEGNYSSSSQQRRRYGSLIYSGDGEAVKYCEMEKGKGGSDVVRVMVWRLVVESTETEWWMEKEFSFPSLPRLCKRLLVAPYPCNRDVVCHPYVIDRSVLVINLGTGSWKLLSVVSAPAAEAVRCFVGNLYKCWPLSPSELSPWSSPDHFVPQCSSATPR